MKKNEIDKLIASLILIGFKEANSLIANTLFYMHPEGLDVYISKIANNVHYYAATDGLLIKKELGVLPLGRNTIKDVTNHLIIVEEDNGLKIYT